MKKWFAEFKSEKDKIFDQVELTYSCLMFRREKWFCRIWHKDWLDRIGRGKKEFGESYGLNKFEAYRKALNDLTNNKNNNE